MNANSTRATDDHFALPKAGHWIALVEQIWACGRSLRRGLAQRAAQWDLSDTQLLLLWSCRNAQGIGLNQNQLATILVFSAAQVSAQVEQLRQKGLLDSRRSATDRRQQHWHLTSEGQSLLDAVAASFDADCNDSRCHLDETERELLLKLLNRLNEGQIANESTSPRRSTKAALIWPIILALSCALPGSLGCTRAFYREQADAEVYDLVDCVADDPRWPLPGYTIEPPPESRMYDPDSPDFPPMPPDDPDSHKYMHCVEGMAGDGVWHASGDTPYVENPDWKEFLPVNDRGQMVLDLDSAVGVAYVNSREYQRELEDLYLSALDVTFERFRFDTQFFLTNSTFFTADGEVRAGGESSSDLTTTTDFEARRLFANGAELVVGVANSLMWQFSGPDSNNVNTLLDFNLVQPLLRFGGRARVLERLTIAERTLLANVRQMVRYQQNFYTRLVTGRDAGQGPSRRGGVFGGSGLEGFTGVGTGGFGQVGGAGGQQAAGQAGVTGGAGAGQAGGFLGLLQQQQQIRNRESNVAALRDSLVQLQAAYDAGRIDRFQVDLARQALYNAQSVLLQAQSAYAAALDNYKIILGLPPKLNIVIQDERANQFELIDPDFPPIQNDISEVQETVGDLIVALRENSQRPDFTIDENFRSRLDQLKAQLDTAVGVPQRVLERVSEVEQDIQKLETSVAQRRDSFQKLSQFTQEELETMDPDDQRTRDIKQALDIGLVDVDALQRLPNQLRADVRTLVAEFEQATGDLQKLRAEVEALGDAGEDGEVLRRRAQAVLDTVPDELLDLGGQVLELSLIQARARGEAIVLPLIELDSNKALLIASHYRLDWMNARANLVDIWRLIEFNANDLESQLDVVLSGDISTIGDNPLNFNGTNGRLRAGLEFDAPLTRLAERNRYRQALIEYQQARRSYYEFVDRVSQALRQSLRTLRLNLLNFELRRAAVQVAVDQVEVARLRLQEPPKPGVQAVLGPTVARDLVSALTDLLNVQNDFLSVWVSYEVERLELDADLGTLRLDDEGLWIDPEKDGRGYDLPCDGEESPQAVESPFQEENDRGVQSPEPVPPVNENYYQRPSAQELPLPTAAHRRRTPLATTSQNPPRKAPWQQASGKPPTARGTKPGSAVFNR